MAFALFFIAEYANIAAMGALTSFHLWVYAILRSIPSKPLLAASTVGQTGVILVALHAGQPGLWLPRHAPPATRASVWWRYSSCSSSPAIGVAE